MGLYAYATLSILENPVRISVYLRPEMRKKKLNEMSCPDFPRTSDYGRIPVTPKSPNLRDISYLWLDMETVTLTQPSHTDPE